MLYLFVLASNFSHTTDSSRVTVALVVEATAPDGTIEAVRVEHAPGSARAFAIGVQWHPEWRYAEDAPSVAIFRTFGAACAAYRQAQR